MGDGDIISAGISAGEIEIDKARDAPIQHQHIIGKQVGMDGRLRQASGPRGGCGQPARHGIGQAGVNLAQPAIAAGGKRRPGGGAKRIGAGRGEIGERPVHLAKCGANLTGGLRRGFSNAHTRQEFDQAGRAAVQHLQNLAAGIDNRARDREALGCKMAHQRQEPGQIASIDALFIKGEDEAPACGFEQEIAVLDAFGDALEADCGADIITGQKGRQIIGADRGVNGHRSATRVRRSANAAA